ncbi:MAG: PAS domain-containing protein, partial [Daejeonella sp.]
MNNSDTKSSLIINEINPEAVLRSFLDSWITITDPEGNVLYLNKAPADYKFLDNSIEIGRSIFSTMADSKQALVKELFSVLLSTGKPFRTNASKVVQGVMVHFEIKYSPVLNETGDISSVLIEAQDVSGAKFFDNKIKRVAGDFTRLLEHANAIIIGTDSQGYITDWNDKCTQVTGYSKNEVFARKLYELIVSELHQDFTMVFNQLLCGKPLANYELSFVDKYGQERILLFNATPRENNQNEVDGILFIGHDITELIAYRTSLEKKVTERTLKLQESNLQIQRQKDEIEKARERSDELLRNIL